MITGRLRNDINKLWEQFWTGGITNPLTVIEQISFLIFARLLDLAEARRERLWTRSRRGEAFPGVLFPPDKQHLRWKNFKHMGDAEQMLKLVRDELFTHMRALSGKESAFGEYLKDAQLLIQRPTLLTAAVKMIDDLPLDQGDTKGDLYEYLLSKLTTAGINGQFRTPRHIIRLMVEMIDPKPTEVIGDPACGTAGFLVGAMLYLLEKYTSKDGWIEQEENGETVRIPSGDLLESYRDHIQKGMFYGFDFDVTMLRIAAMNLMLHDVASPHIYYQDTLSRSFRESRAKLAENNFDVVFANPPFKGSLDAEDVDPTLTAKVKTKKTELLFLALVLRMLKSPGGRAAVIVPDGVLFGSSKAHVELRKMLVEENQLDAVISLPSGVFKPYAGVSTAILVLTKGGRTDDVFFYDVQADGLSLDDKREKIDANDLPDCLARWGRRDAGKDTDRSAKHFMVPVKEIEERNFDLSISRYKETKHEEVEYGAPKQIIGKLRVLEADIAKELDEMERML